MVETPFGNTEPKEEETSEEIIKSCGMNCAECFYKVETSRDVGTFQKCTLPETHTCEYQLPKVIKLTHDFTEYSSDPEANNPITPFD